MKMEIVLCGVGGQGLISTGEIIGEAASIHEGKMATLSSAYGTEARGTFTKSDVILSDRIISYPNVEIPDVILCLAQVAYDRYADVFTDQTLVYYDEDSVTPAPGAKGKHRGYPFGKMSIGIGSALVANTIALGVMIGQTDMLGRDSVAAVIEERFAGNQKVIQMNIAALDAGLALK